MNNEQQKVYIEKKQFYCDGGEHGHPRVYFTMNTEGFEICNYCNIKYIFQEEEEY